MDRLERLDDAEESTRLALESHQAKMWTAMPAIVESVDLEAQTLSAQPTIQGQFTDEQGNRTNADMPLCVDVPICFPRAGGFALTFPIAAGDEVLLVFASRCIDEWWQNGTVSPQAELRMHDLSDGFALLAPTSQPKVLPAVSSDNVQLRDQVGTTFLEITPDGRINLTAIAEINMSAPTINMNAAAAINLAAPVIGINATTSGTLTSPAIQFIGQFTADGGQIFDGITFGLHRHEETGSITYGPQN